MHNRKDIPVFYIGVSFFSYGRDILFWNEVLLNLYF